MKTAIYTLALTLCSLVASTGVQGMSVVTVNTPMGLDVTTNPRVTVAAPIPPSPFSGGLFTLRAIGDFDSLGNKDEFIDAFLGGPTPNTFLNLGRFGRFTNGTDRPNSVTATTPFGTSIVGTVSLTAAQLASVYSNGAFRFGFNSSVFVSDGSVEASLTYNAVPEPAAMTLLAVGGAVAGFGAIRRRRQSAGIVS